MLHTGNNGLYGRHALTLRNNPKRMIPIKTLVKHVLFSDSVKL